MNWKVRFKTLWFIVLIFFGVLTVTCTQGKKYQLLVKKELETNIRYDTLLKGLRFGMNKREFFAHCWDLHKKGDVKEGFDNVSVYFSMKRNGKSYNVSFYPKFQNGKIANLPIKYSYAAFAPWNRKYSLDSLAFEILQLYKENYGNDFIELDSNDKNKGVAYVRVDGNRRISIYKNINKNNVIVNYHDLLAVKKLNTIKEEDI